MIFGNCSLALAPIRPGTEERVAEFLSYVEAIPMDVLKTVDYSWETIPEYMDTLEQRLGDQRGEPDRPLCGAALRHGRRKPGA